MPYNCIMIDLRSDTVTKPTQAMLSAMMQAQVGDDVYGDDPSVIELEQYCADIFHHDAALFCPSGTMTNQIAINVYTKPGDEVICADLAHIFKYEGGGMAANSGAQARTLPSDKGIIAPDQIKLAINSDDPHFSRTALVSVENTSNRGGGKCYTHEQLVAISNFCKQHNLPLHVDGARIFNAIIAEQYTPAQVGSLCDSISVCLSKGLGAPIGSVLIGSKDFIAQAKRIRKRMGGGMRQAGYLAAAGLYALKNNVERLAIDHTHAKEISTALLGTRFVKSTLPVETNIIIFECIDEHTCDKFAQYLQANAILANKVSASAMRFVFHLDVSQEQVQMLKNCITTFEKL